MQDFRYLYYLTGVEGLGPVRIKKLLEHFGSSEEIFSAGVKELTAIDGFSTKTADSILSSRNDVDKLEKKYDELLKRCVKDDINVVTISDDTYPALLKEIYDPPLILYYKCKDRNSYNKLSSKSVGIVGTRSPSDYGKKMAETFAGGLSDEGINIISGFARGVDTFAHRSALKSGKSITAAIFGCGVDVIYPPENKKLYEEIYEHGILISEYEVGSKPDSKNFPRRNRVISGLSNGVIVIESGKDGGALITARCALDHGREVFAVPGYITSKQSEGTNNLIKNGHAKLVENIDDVLNEIGGGLNSSLNGKLNGKNSSKGQDINLSLFNELSGNEKTISDILISSSVPEHIDAISEKTELNISDCLVALLNLEFKGLVNQLPGKRFTIVG